MEHSFITRAEADRFLVENHPEAQPVPAVSSVLNSTVFLDREQEVVIRVNDYSDDPEEPVVNVHVLAPRVFITDQDVADQVESTLIHGDEEDRRRLRPALAELAEIFKAGLPNVWRDRSVNGVLVNLESLRSDLEATLTTITAVRDAEARRIWTEQSATGAELAGVAKDLYLSATDLTEAILADRARFRDL